MYIPEQLTWMILENKDIRLRALEPADISLLFLWENNRENWRISNTIQPYSRTALTQYIESVGDVYSDRQLRLIIERKDKAEPLGAIDLFDCDFKNKRAGIGILVADDKNRGKGIGSACLEVMIDYVFNTLDLHQIYCNVLMDNPESLALFEKFGFKNAGIKKDWIYHEGQFVDECTMQLIKNS